MERERERERNCPSAGTKGHAPLVLPRAPRSVQPQWKTKTSTTGYMFAKNRCMNLTFGMQDFQTWFSNVLYVFSQIFGFCEKLYENFSFNFLGGFFFGKSETAFLKNSLFYVFCCFLFAFCLKSPFLVILILKFWNHLSNVFKIVNW